jgi:hypothetical protein
VTARRPHPPLRRAGLMTAALAALGGCGGSADSGRLGRGPVRWAHAPSVVRNPRLPNDRVLLGEIRNTTRRMFTLDARRVVVRDGTGRVLASAARFTNSYGHPLYGAFQKPSYVDPVELARLGIVAGVTPGDTIPLFVSYRLTASSRPPITATLSRGLTLPLAQR